MAVREPRRGPLRPPVLRERRPEHVPLLEAQPRTGVPVRERGGAATDAAGGPFPPPGRVLRPPVSVARRPAAEAEQAVHLLAEREPRLEGLGRVVPVPLVREPIYY